MKWTPAADTPSTPRSTPTSRRSSPTWRRSRPTSASRCSFPRSGRSSSRASTSSRRRFRRSTRGPSRRPAGAARSRARWAAIGYTALRRRDAGGGRSSCPARGSASPTRTSRSVVAIGARAARLGRSFVSCSLTDREDRRRRPQPRLRPRFPVAADAAESITGQARSATRRRRTGPTSQPSGTGDSSRRTRRPPRWCHHTTHFDGFADLDFGEGSAPTTASCRRSATAKHNRKIRLDVAADRPLPAERSFVDVRTK